ncbi:hypothetical protein HWV62_20505 [Athelia sp. TMB]|nr:hypothetical protein HWV62_20505 [Athelia sp. TMB]
MPPKLVHEKSIIHDPYIHSVFAAIEESMAERAARASATSGPTPITPPPTVARPRYQLPLPSPTLSPTPSPPPSSPTPSPSPSPHRPSVRALPIATPVPPLPTPSSPTATESAARQAKRDGKKKQQGTKPRRRILRDDEYDEDDEYGGQDPAFDKLVATVELDDNDCGTTGTASPDDTDEDDEDVSCGYARTIRGPVGPPVAVRSPRRPKYAAFVVLEGRTPGIFNTWDMVENSTNGISAAIFEGFQSVLHAERAWVLGNRARVVRTVDGSEEPGPRRPYTQALSLSLSNLPRDFCGEEWCVVSRGLCPGVYPCWILAASQVLQVRTSVYIKCSSKEHAFDEYRRAVDNNAVVCLA